MSDVHGEYVEKCLRLHLDKALVLNIDDYYNIHVQKQADTTNNITDRHLPRGFVTSKKPNTTILCDYTDCDCTNILSDGSILACGHGYHSRCLQRCQFKCFICLGYLQDEITKNVNAMLSSMTKEYVEDEMIEESEENVADDDLSDIDGITDDALVVDNLLERAKYLFSEQ